MNIFNREKKNEEHESFPKATDEKVVGEVEKTLDEIIEEAKQEVLDENPFQKKIDELQRQLEIFKDQALRKAAEFENYKRRTEQEYQNLIKFSNEYLISALLPVVDDFERSLNSGKEKPDFDSFYKGIELIYSKFMKVLEAKGLKVIESVNKPFDVNFHEAMMTMPREDVPPSTVIQEIEKGYSLNDKVIRHTKVFVSSEVTPIEEIKMPDDEQNETKE